MNTESIARYDAVVILTDHDSIDFSVIARHSRLVIDTRNGLGSRGIACSRVVKA